MGWNRSHPKVIQGTKSANWAWVRFCCQRIAELLQLPSRGSVWLCVFEEATWGTLHHSLIFPNVRGHFIVLIVRVRTRAAMPPETRPGEGAGSVTLVR